MNLSTEIKEHIDSVLDDKTLGWLFPALETGQAVCKEFINFNSEFFNCSDYLNMVPGHLLSYSINKQLLSQCLLSSSPFQLHKEEINKRNKYSIPVIKKGNISISIMRTPTREEIDNTGKQYLKSKCKKNKELDGQISLIDTVSCEEHYYHGVLLYGTTKKWEGISFADIIFFDSDLKQIHHSLNLIDKLHVYESSMSTEDKEKSLLNANNIIKDAKLQLEGL